MNSILHYATCRSWESGLIESCSCFFLPAWKIRKEEGELFPWRIWRRVNGDDPSYQHVMRCSSWQGAVELVSQFIWLRNNAIQRESSV